MSAHVSERLSAYLDDELDPAGRAAVDEHLGACEACARDLEALAAIDGLARELPPDEAPPGYFEAFPARVRGRLKGRSRHTAWRLPTWTWVAAAAALLVVIAPLALNRARPVVPPVEAPVAERAAPGERAAEGERADARARAPLAPAPAAPRAAPPAVQEGFARAPAASPPPARNQLPAREAARDAAAPDTSGPGSPPPPKAAAIPTEAGASGLTASQARRSGPGGPLGQSQQLAESGRAPRPGAPASESDEQAGKAAGAPESKVAAEAASKEEQRPEEPRPLSKGRLGSRAGGEDQYRALLVRPTRTLAEARELREAWRAFSLRHPTGPHADEARVRVVEAGVLAWNLGRGSEDMMRARADAEAYLARSDAAQAARVRAALEDLER